MQLPKNAVRSNRCSITGIRTEARWFWMQPLCQFCYKHNHHSIFFKTGIRCAFFIIFGFFQLMMQYLQEIIVKLFHLIYSVEKRTHNLSIMNLLSFTTRPGFQSYNDIFSIKLRTLIFKHSDWLKTISSQSVS